MDSTMVGQMMLESWNGVIILRMLHLGIGKILHILGGLFGFWHGVPWLHMSASG